MDRPKLSVVIPAYNEAQNIKNGVLSKVYDYLKKQNYSWEVLIVDDGSEDNTVELVSNQIKNKTGFKLIRNPHGGKALTVISGMLQTSGEIALFTDMDQATPLDQIEKFFPKFEGGADIVVGSRGGRQGAPFVRKLTAWVFSMLRNIILGLPLSDTQCGFKAFRHRSVQIIFPKMMELRKNLRSDRATTNAGFDVEILFYAKKHGFKIAEVPVTWHYVPTERFNLIKDAVEVARDMLRVRFGDFEGKYD